MKDIKGMKLYCHPERIYNELAAAGFRQNGPLKVEDISCFDQYHYFGTKAVDDATSILGIDSKKKVVDIGSGIGGPARYLAEKTGCHVTAVELQPDLNKIADSLTKRCGLSGRVQHLRGDILRLSDRYRDFDIVVSWLSFLHIPDRHSLFKKCNAILKPGGKIFIEDFCRRGKLNKNELMVLSLDIYCDYLPTREEYRRQLAENGFAEVKIADKTLSWKKFVKERLERFAGDRSRNIRTHNTRIVKELEYFYKKMSCLFAGNNLGGLRITAVKS